MIIHEVATAYTFTKDFSEILLVNHKSLNVWLPPGGHVKKNETFPEAALRELYEETGVTATLIDFNYQKVLKNVNRTSLNFDELLRPLTLIKELIPNSESEDEHWHIDAVYVALAESKDIVKSLDPNIFEAKWFTVKTINVIKTLPNVLEIVHYILEKDSSKTINYLK